MLRIVLIILPFMIAAPALADDGPAALIKASTEELATMLDENRDRYQEDQAALREDVKSVLIPTMDTIYSARLVLGRHSRGRDREQVEAFADALINQLLNRYATALLDYDLHGRVEFLPLAGDNTERATRVRTRVLLDNGQRAPVDYVLRKGESGWKVFDVIVEGISYVATFRSQIDQEIRSSSFADVLERLDSGQLALDVDE